MADLTQLVHLPRGQACNIASQLVSQQLPAHVVKALADVRRTKTAPLPQKVADERIQQLAMLLTRTDNVKTCGHQDPIGTAWPRVATRCWRPRPAADNSYLLATGVAAGCCRQSREALQAAANTVVD